MKTATLSTIPITIILILAALFFWLVAVAPNVSLITFTHHARANHALRLLEIPLLPEARSTPENVGVMTDDGLVSPTQVRQIVEMMNQGESGAAIERAIWGYDGGAAFRMRKAVVEALRATGGDFPAYP